MRVVRLKIDPLSWQPVITDTREKGSGPNPVLQPTGQFIWAAKPILGWGRRGTVSRFYRNPAFAYGREGAPGYDPAQADRWTRQDIGVARRFQP